MRNGLASDGYAFPDATAKSSESAASFDIAGSVRGAGQQATIGKEVFNLVQFHFHAPSGVRWSSTSSMPGRMNASPSSAFS
jgi:hypothetical protein